MILNNQSSMFRIMISRKYHPLLMLLSILIIIVVYISLIRYSVENCDPNSRGTNSKPYLPHFPEYLKANEKIRERFLQKRKSDLVSGRRIKEVPLWELWQGGWQSVWNHFPPLFTCPHLVERVGTAKDGGKWICGLSVFENKSPCVIYSLGVGGDSSFEVEMVNRTSCSVFAYDYTVDDVALPGNLDPELKNRIHFFKLGLGSNEKAKNDPMFKTLGQLMEDNGHEWIDFLKVDIEGAEFELLTEMNDQYERIPYGHLNIEIHLNEMATMKEVDLQKQEFQKLLKFWESLESKGLRSWWWEDNYSICAAGRGPPVLIEYAFINILDQERNKLIQF